MSESLLKAYLMELDPGLVTDAVRLAEVLSNEWDSLDGAEAGGMQAFKLHGRMEAVEWCSPVLSFEIERHGGTCQGSKKGEVQAWRVDVSEWTASLVGSRSRRLKPFNKRLEIAPLAEQVRNAITRGQSVDFLDWISEDKVKVRIGKIIPDQSPKATIEDRRRRFRKTLEAKLLPDGWRSSAPNTFGKHPQVVAAKKGSSAPGPRPQRNPGATQLAERNSVALHSMA